MPEMKKTAAETQQFHKRLAHQQAQLVKADSLRLKGDLDGAETLCKQVLQNAPTHVGALRTLGLISLQRHNYRQAMNCFLTATATAPEDAGNPVNLAAAWLGLERPGMAAIFLREAERLQPDNAAVAFMRGEVLLAAQDHEAALPHYERALELDGGNEQAVYRLVECHRALGGREQVARLCQWLLDAGSRSIQLPNVLAGYQSLTGFENVDLRQLVDAARPSPGERPAQFEATKAFVLAAVLHREGKFEGAWNAAARGNRLLEAEHRPAWAAQATHRELALSCARSAVKRKLPGDRPGEAGRVRPLFILGASRSGKTSVERLATECDVARPGREWPGVHAAVRRAAQNAGLDNFENPLLMPDELLVPFGSELREGLGSRAGAADVVTVTHPALIANVFHLARVLPEARFVFVERDRNDLAARMFMRGYRSGNHHACALDTIGEYLGWYDELAQLWRDALGPRAVTVSFEEMVADPDRTRSVVLEHCGLDPPPTPAVAIPDDVGYCRAYASFMRSGPARPG